MNRRGRLLLWAPSVLSIPATMTFLLVHTPEPAHREPQVAASIHTVQIGAGSSAGATAVRAALTRLGAPYSWAAAGPHAFDCSGLVVWAFEQAGVSLPHSSQALADGGQPVRLQQMQPGDVITYYSDASHVGLYVGGGKMVHASTYGIPVAVVPVDNAPIYNVRRYR